MKALSFAFVILVAGLLLAPPVTASDEVAFTTWKVPWEKSRPRDPYVSPADGTVWFVGQGSHYLANIDPATGKMRKFELPDGTGPHNCIIDDDGDVWIAGNLVARIFRFDRETQQLEEFPMPLGLDDPHTLMFDRASDDNLWFTAQQSNRIAYLDTLSGEVEEWTLPIKGSRPYGLVVSDKGQPWIALFGTNHLATIVDAKLQLVELPRKDARPRRLELSSTGDVWYVDYARGYLGVYHPDDGTFEEWRSPSEGNARPYGMAIDDEDRIWYVETGPQPNRWIGFDTHNHLFVANMDIPDSGGAVRHMDYDPETNSIWFGMDSNFIGRARLDADVDPQ